MHHTKIYTLLAILLLITEVIIATKLNHYPFIRHYFGDFLVVILLYFMVKAVININAKPLAIGVFLFAVGIETTQYFHLADHLGLARGNMLRIVIGTSFSVSDLAMYATGTLFVYWFDLLVFERRWKKN
jgi:hypothetical protein